MKMNILAIAAIVMMTSACGDSSTPAQEETTPTTTTEAPAVETPDANTAQVTIHGGDDMKFDRDEITVKEGQTVILTLIHSGKAPITAMGHNVVILAPGVDVNAFATAAIAAKDNDYIPQDMAGDVIAHTKTIGGGETTEITFPAPAKGTYDFICSFPGHAGMMKGKFIVE